MPSKFTSAVPDDVNIIKFSFLLIDNDADGHAYIAKVFNKRKIRTFDYAFSVRELVMIDVSLEKLLTETQGRRVPRILSAKNDGNPRCHLTIWRSITIK